MILPGMGIVSELISTFSQKKIYGYKAIAFSSLAIAFISFLVWGHHMFVSGQSQLASMIFSFLTFMVGIPSGIKVFNWVATLYKGKIRFDTPWRFYSCSPSEDSLAYFLARWRPTFIFTIPISWSLIFILSWWAGL